MATTASPSKPIQRRDILLLPACLPLFLVVIPGLQAYITNYDELPLQLSPLASMLAATSAALYLPAVAILWFGNSGVRKWFGICIVIMASTGLVISNVLTWDFGILRAGIPDWDQYTMPMLFELAAMVSLSVLVITQWSCVVQHYRTFMVLAVVYCAIVSVDHLRRFATTQVAGPTDADAFFSRDGVFDFSATTNLILLHVDAFQSDLFYELLETAPHIKNELNGFTYFPNAVSPNADKTQLCVGNYLASTIFDADRSIPEYRRDFRFASSGLPVALADAGFDSRMLPRYDSVIPEPRLWHNISKTDSAVTNQSATLIAALTAFKVAPITLKKYLFPTGELHFPFGRQVKFYRGCIPRLTSSTVPTTPMALHGKLVSPEVASDFDFTLLREFCDAASVTTSQPVARHYLIKGLHLPLFTDVDYQPVSRPDVQYGNTPVSRDTAMGLAVVYWNWLHAFLDKLRDIGVYDNALIVIIGDHGLGFPASPDFAAVTDRLTANTLPAAYRPSATEASIDISRRQHEMSLPLFLVKPLKSRQAFRTSFAPVSLIDVAPTVLAALNIIDKTPQNGAVDVFSLPEDAERHRAVTHVDLAADESTVLAVHRFTVSGFSWHRSSWSRP